MVLEEHPDIMARFVKTVSMFQHCQMLISPTGLTIYRGADKSLAPPGRKQVTATEDFEFPIS